MGDAAPPRSVLARSCASALPSGNAPARAQNCGIETPTGHFNVRNLSDPHVNPSQWIILRRKTRAVSHRACGSASGKSWLAVAASALPSGNAPARAQKCGIEMPTGHFNVRNLADPHARCETAQVRLIGDKDGLNRRIGS